MIHGQLRDDDLGLDVDESDPRVGVLVLHDESQGGVELFVPSQSRGRPADAGVEHLPLVDAESFEQFTLVGEPAIQRRAGYAGLQRHFGEAEFGLPTAAEHLRGRHEYPVPRRGVFDVLGCVPLGA